MYRPCILNHEQPPCYKNGKNCEKRHVGCHSTCKEYIAFKEARNSKLEDARKHNSVSAAFYEQDQKKKWAAIKKINNRRK